MVVRKEREKLHRKYALTPEKLNHFYHLCGKAVAPRIGSLRTGRG